MIPFEDYKRSFASFNDEPVGAGGQKVVYRATHPEYGDVVVKVLRHADARTERELAISSTYDFPHVPRIFAREEISYEGAKTDAVVEEFIDGTSLRNIIASGKRFDLWEAADFLGKALSFLAVIWDERIVHRDIKPENIIMKDGEPFFIDFGIARVLDAESLTQTGDMGPNTPGYAAPEQFGGLKDMVDGRADLFSIGVVTYEVVTGENPFTKAAAGPFDIYYNTMTVTPMSYSIPGDSEQQFMGLLSSLMSRNISARPKDAREALGWLRSAEATFDKSRRP